MKTQAWGWLVVAVLAAGLNASYYDGGLQWAHRFADRVENTSASVLTLASQGVDQIRSEAQLVTAQNETASCRLAAALARVQAKVARTQVGLDRFEVMSAREQAQLARLEANRARMEAQIAVQADHLRIPMADFNPVVLRSIQVPVVCPRVRINVPRMPAMKMPVAPVVHVEIVNAGPV